MTAFVDEEGARFRTACFASLAITGRLDIDEALAVMGDAPAIYGVTRESLLESRAQLEHVGCFLEVHVEQGRALVDRGQALGIADVLAPRQRWRAEFEGESNHAGTTPMAGRRDALAAGGAVHPRGRRGGPGAPGRGRHRRPGRDLARLDELDPGPRGLLARRARARGRDDRRPRGRARGALAPTPTSPQASRNGGASFDAGLRAALHASAAAAGVTAGDLPSYAGHDAGILALHVPAAMLFVRNPTGASHTPAESASDDDCVAAAQVLAGALAELVAR